MQCLYVNIQQLWHGFGSHGPTLDIYYLWKSRDAPVEYFIFGTYKAQSTLAVVTLNVCTCKCYFYMKPSQRQWSSVPSQD